MYEIKYLLEKIDGENGESIMLDIDNYNVFLSLIKRKYFNDYDADICNKYPDLKKMISYMDGTRYSLPSRYRRVFNDYIVVNEMLNSN